MTKTIQHRRGAASVRRVLIGLQIAASIAPGVLAAQGTTGNRVALPLKYGAFERINSVVLGGPAVTAQFEMSGRTGDALQLRLQVRSLPPKGQTEAQAGVVLLDANGSSFAEIGPVAGVRRLDDASSSAPVATDTYLFTVTRDELAPLLREKNLSLRAFGKKVDFDERRLGPFRKALEELVAGTSATTPTQVVERGAGSRNVPDAVQSRTIVVLQSKVVDGRSAGSTSVVPDSSVRHVPATTQCGTGRLCTNTWDLRIGRFVVDDSAFAPDGFLQARVVVENRGARPSELSELRLCVTSALQCIGDAVVVSLPPLHSGEKLEIAQPVPGYAGRDVAPPHGLLASIDPEKVTREVNRAGNEAMIRTVTLDTASLAIDNFDIPRTLRANPSQVPITLVVRNASRVASLAPSFVQLGGRCSYVWWGDVATRLHIPRLGPSQVWSATIAVRQQEAVRKDSNCELWLSPLKSSNPDEREDEDRRIRRSYSIVGTPE